jgi:hypothetical protein
MTVAGCLEADRPPRSLIRRGATMLRARRLRDTVIEWNGSPCSGWRRRRCESRGGATVRDHEGIARENHGRHSKDFRCDSVYNEAGTIGEVIRRVLECGFETEVIVVDYASTDDTPGYLDRWSIRRSTASITRSTGARARRCAPALRRHAIRTSWSRTPTLSTTHATTDICSRPCSTAVPTWFTARAFSAGRIACSSSGTIWGTGCRRRYHAVCESSH